MSDELALCGRENECARTDSVFFLISEVSKGIVSLNNSRQWTVDSRHKTLNIRQQTVSCLFGCFVVWLLCQLGI